MPPTVAAVPILVPARDVAIDPNVAPPVIARPADVVATVVVPIVELLPDDPAISVVVAAAVPTAAVLAVFK